MSNAERDSASLDQLTMSAWLAASRARDHLEELRDGLRALLLIAVSGHLDESATAGIDFIRRGLSDALDAASDDLNRACQMLRKPTEPRDA